MFLLEVGSFPVLHGGQCLVRVAEMILAELGGHVALRLEELGYRDIPRLQAFLCARQANLEQAGPKARLAGDEGPAAGGATLLAVPVGEHRAFFGDAVNIGGLVAHHAVVVGAGIPVADVVSPDDEDIGFSPWACRRLVRRLARSDATEKHQARHPQREAIGEEFVFRFHVSCPYL